MSLPAALPLPQSLSDRYYPTPPAATVSRSPSISTVISAASNSKSSVRRPSTPFTSLFQRCRPSVRRRSVAHDAMSSPVVDSRGLPSLTVTPAEFHTLPPSIQRKYFSSTERLHIARRHRKSQSIYVESPPRTTNDDMLASALSRRPSRPLANPGTNSVDAVPSREDDMSEEQALFFMKLPDKIRRQQFSKEELASLTARCQRVLQQSSPASTAQTSFSHNVTSPPSSTAHHKQASRSSSQPSVCASFESSSPGQRALKSSRNRSLNQMESRPAVVNFSRPPSASTTSTADMQSTASKPASKPPTPTGARSDSTDAYYRAPVRRKSLTPIALPPPTLSPAPAPPVPYIRSKSVAAFRPRSRTSPSPDPAAGLPTATYFHDQATKRRLRESTASSDAFDETVLYGFPTTCSDCSRKSQAVEIRGRVKPTEESAVPALRCQSPSLPRPFVLDCSDTDDESSRGPLTPKFNHDNLLVQKELEKASIDSGVGMSYSLSSSPVSDAVQPFETFKAPREQTLRLTLTRPDLRENTNRPLYALNTASTTDVTRYQCTDIDSRPPLHLRLRPGVLDEARTPGTPKSDGASIVTLRSTKDNLVRLLKKL